MPNLDNAIKMLEQARRDYHARWGGTMDEKNLNNISYFHAVTEASYECSVEPKVLSDEFLRRNPNGISKGITDDGEELGASGDPVPSTRTRPSEAGRDHAGSETISDVSDRSKKTTL
jgi:hypothetical protein